MSHHTQNVGWDYEEDQLTTWWQVVPFFLLALCAIVFLPAWEWLGRAGERIRIGVRNLHREMLAVWQETERVSAENRRLVKALLFRQPNGLSSNPDDYDEHGRPMPAHFENGGQNFSYPTRKPAVDQEEGDWAHEQACERDDGPGNFR